MPGLRVAGVELGQDLDFDLYPGMFLWLGVDLS